MPKYRYLLPGYRPYYVTYDEEQRLRYATHLQWLFSSASKMGFTEMEMNAYRKSSEEACGKEFVQKQKEFVESMIGRDARSSDSVNINNSKNQLLDIVKDLHELIVSSNVETRVKSMIVASAIGCKDFNTEMKRNTLQFVLYGPSENEKIELENYCTAVSLHFLGNNIAYNLIQLSAIFNTNGLMNIMFNEPPFGVEFEMLFTGSLDDYEYYYMFCSKRANIEAKNYSVSHTNLYNKYLHKHHSDPHSLSPDLLQAYTIFRCDSDFSDLSLPSWINRSEFYPLLPDGIQSHDALVQAVHTGNFSARILALQLVLHRIKRGERIPLSCLTDFCLLFPILWSQND